jgi:short-subunit dehydrogenase involved in D-alanine esterification of teichoic acids
MGSNPANISADSEGVAALREFLERKFGRLDVLINNTGIITDEDTFGLEVPLAAETRLFSSVQLSLEFSDPFLQRSDEVMNLLGGVARRNV